MRYQSMVGEDGERPGSERSLGSSLDPLDLVPPASTLRH